MIECHPSFTTAWKQYNLILMQLEKGTIWFGFTLKKGKVWWVSSFRIALKYSPLETKGAVIIIIIVNFDYYFYSIYFYFLTILFPRRSGFRIHFSSLFPGLLSVAQWACMQLQIPPGKLVCTKRFCRALGKKKLWIDALRWCFPAILKWHFIADAGGLYRYLKEFLHSLC